MVPPPPSDSSRTAVYQDGGGDSGGGPPSLGGIGPIGILPSSRAATATADTAAALAAVLALGTDLPVPVSSPRQPPAAPATGRPAPAHAPSVALSPLPPPLPNGSEAGPGPGSGPGPGPGTGAAAAAAVAAAEVAAVAATVSVRAAEAASGTPWTCPHCRRTNPGSRTRCSKPCFRWRGGKHPMPRRPPQLPKRPASPAAGASPSPTLEEIAAAAAAQEEGGLPPVPAPGAGAMTAPVAPAAVRKRRRDDRGGGGRGSGKRGRGSKTTQKQSLERWRRDQAAAARGEGAVPPPPRPGPIAAAPSPFWFCAKCQRYNPAGRVRCHAPCFRWRGGKRPGLTGNSNSNAHLKQLGKILTEEVGRSRSKKGTDLIRREAAALAAEVFPRDDHGEDDSDEEDGGRSLEAARETLERERTEEAREAKERKRKEELREGTDLIRREAAALAAEAFPSDDDDGDAMEDGGLATKLPASRKVASKPVRNHDVESTEEKKEELQGPDDPVLDAALKADAGAAGAGADSGATHSGASTSELPPPLATAGSPTEASTGEDRLSDFHQAVEAEEVNPPSESQPQKRARVESTEIKDYAATKVLDLHYPDRAKVGRAGDEEGSAKSQERDFSFDAADSVKVDYKGVLYRATVLKRRKNEGSAEYYVHYEGFKKSRDEWVNKEVVYKHDWESNKKSISPKYTEKVHIENQNGNNSDGSHASGPPEGAIKPKKRPQQNRDTGLFKRPLGAAPKGRVWNSLHGVWALVVDNAVHKKDKVENVNVGSEKPAMIVGDDSVDSDDSDGFELPPGALRPKTKPKRDAASGGYKRPKGFAPGGRIWNTKYGIWVEKYGSTAKDLINVDKETVDEIQDKKDTLKIAARDIREEREEDESEEAATVPEGTIRPKKKPVFIEEERVYKRPMGAPPGGRKGGMSWDYKLGVWVRKGQNNVTADLKKQPREQPQERQEDTRAPKTNKRATPPKLPLRINAPGKMSAHSVSSYVESESDGRPAISQKKPSKRIRGGVRAQIEKRRSMFGTIPKPSVNASDDSDDSDEGKGPSVRVLEGEGADSDSASPRSFSSSRSGSPKDDPKKNLFMSREGKAAYFKVELLLGNQSNRRKMLPFQMRSEEDGDLSTASYVAPIGEAFAIRIKLARPRSEGSLYGGKVYIDTPCCHDGCGDDCTHVKSKGSGRLPRQLKSEPDHFFWIGPGETEYIIDGFYSSRRSSQQFIFSEPPKSLDLGPSIEDEDLMTRNARLMRAWRSIGGIRIAFTTVEGYKDRSEGEQRFQKPRQAGIDLDAHMDRKGKQLSAAPGEQIVDSFPASSLCREAILSDETTFEKRLLYNTFSGYKAAQETQRHVYNHELYRALPLAVLHQADVRDQAIMTFVIKVPKDRMEVHFNARLEASFNRSRPISPAAAGESSQEERTIGGDNTFGDPEAWISVSDVVKCMCEYLSPAGSYIICTGSDRKAEKGTEKNYGEQIVQKVTGVNDAERMLDFAHKQRKLWEYMRDSPGQYDVSGTKIGDYKCRRAVVDLCDSDSDYD